MDPRGAVSSDLVGGQGREVDKWGQMKALFFSAPYNTCKSRFGPGVHGGFITWFCNLNNDHNHSIDLHPLKPNLLLLLGGIQVGVVMRRILWFFETPFLNQPSLSSLAFPAPPPI